MATAKKPVSGARKSAPAAKVPPRLPDDEDAPAEGPQFALTGLATELGAADPALLAALLQDTPDSELVESGVRIGSAKVVTDATRMLGIGWTFYKGASTDQKRLLRGCSRDLFVLAVGEALRLEQLLNQQETQRQHEAGVRESSSVAENTVWDRAIGRRDQAASVLSGAAGSPKARATVSKAVGTAETSGALARGLESLAKTLEGWVEQATDDDALKLRLALFSLDADYAKELRQTAEALRHSSATVQNPPQTARVSQLQLDRQDGVCLLLLGRVMRAFERGNALDRTIPRLVPLATRSILAPRRRARSGDSSVPAPTAPTAPNPT